MLVRRRDRAGDAALDLRFSIRVGQNRKRLGRIVAGLHLQRGQSMVRPSSRGGVPVFKRPSAKPSRSSVLESPMAGASPTRPAGNLLFADMNEPAQKRAGGQNHRAAAEISRPSASLTPQTRPLSIRRSSASASITLQIRRCANRGLHRRRIELAVGLGARTAHGRAFARGSARGTGCRPGRRRGPSGRRGRRSRGPDGPCRARRWPDCSDMAPTVAKRCVTSAVRAPMRRGRGRGLAAGMAAANHDDVESSTAWTLTMARLVAEAGGAVKNNRFCRNVSRETLPRRYSVPNN